MPKLGPPPLGLAPTAADGARAIRAGSRRPPPLGLAPSARDRAEAVACRGAESEMEGRKRKGEADKRAPCDCEGEFKWAEMICWAGRVEGTELAF